MLHSLPWGIRNEKHRAGSHWITALLTRKSCSFRLTEWQHSWMLEGKHASAQHRKAREIEVMVNSVKQASLTLAPLQASHDAVVRASASL